MRWNASRPTRLSDPGGDFVDEEELRSILATPDKQMAFYEFNCLFQGRLPCLKQLGAEGERMARAEALIVEETLRNPLHLRFWDRELATYY